MSLANANSGRGLQSTNDVDTDPTWVRIHDLIVELFPVKTAFHLSDITGLSVSAWQKSLREKRAPSAGALVSLLRSSVGFKILRTLLSDDEFTLMWDEAQLEAKRQDIQRRREALRGRP